MTSCPSKVKDEECKISPFEHASLAWAKSVGGTEEMMKNSVWERVGIARRLTGRGRDIRHEGEGKGNKEFELHVGVTPGGDLWGYSAFQMTMAYKR